MPIDLYYVPGSAPCRAVQLVAAAVGVDLNLKLTDLMSGEHLKPEFLKLNPQHTLPTIDDNGFHLWESRAICTYLVEKYGKNDSLYPKDPQKRAIVNQRLYFDNGTLYQAAAEYYYPPMFYGKPRDPEKFEKIGTALGFLEKFLEGQNYVAGNNLTIADLTILATVTTLEALDYDLSKYSNTSKWLARLKTEATNYEEANGKGIKAFKELVAKLSKK